MASLKILFFATRDWYHPATTGGDNTMWENARYLASVGHSVTYITSGFPGAARKVTLDSLDVVRLGGIHSLWLRSFLYYIRHCRGRYDVVVTEGFGGSRIPRLVPLYVKGPVITEWHQVHRELFAAQYPRFFLGPLNLLERVTAWVHRNTFVRAGTKEWKAAFHKLGFSPEKIVLVPVSIREEWLEHRAGNRASVPTILWLGKFRRYKVPHHAVLAMQDVLKRVPSARLILAGRHDDRNYERSIEKLVGRLGLERSVEFRFNISEEEKRRLLENCRVVVLPSSVEGFGIVVLEANACGVPVVASSGVPDGAVKDGLNGLKYEYGDINAFSEALGRVLSDDALHAGLSRSAFEFAATFAWRGVGAQFERLVKQAAGGVTP